jgi:glycosyltransferase involved in cell wall biosynthesis
MHILIANNIYPPIMAGGAELIVAELAEGLVRRGHKVTVVSTCSPKNEPYPVEIRNSVEVIRFFPKNRYWHWERENRRGYEKALWHLQDAWNKDAGKRFRQIITEYRPDVLHTHLIDGMSAILWRRAKQAGIPVVHTAHDYHLLCPRALLLNKSLEICEKPELSCRIYRGWHIHTTRDIDLFCSPSQFLINKHTEAGLAAKRTAVMRNGITLPAHLEKIHDKSSPGKFLFAARLTIEKGCEVLLKALTLLPKDIQFEFSIAGKGVYADKFIELAKNDSRIKYLGYISGSDKDAIFRKNDWLLLPSLWYENAPVVIIEAAAYKMGVIGSNIGAIPEFVQHEKTGLLFDPGNPKALAETIIRAVNDQEILRNIEKFTPQILSNSSIDNMVDGYLEHYKSVIPVGNKK